MTGPVRSYFVTPAELSQSLFDLILQLSERRRELPQIGHTPNLRALAVDPSVHGVFGDAEVQSNALEVHVSSLRRKLGRDVIETMRGLGYRLMPAQEPH